MMMLLLLMMTMIYTVYMLLTSFAYLPIHGSCRQLRTRLSPRKSFARRRKRRANNAHAAVSDFNGTR